MTMKVGFIGTGGVARAHITNLAQMEGATISAFCDLQLERAETAAKEWTDAKAYSNIADMLDDRKLDAAFLCLPPMAHGEAERALIERGIPFLVEKPLGVNNELPRQLADQIAEKGLITSVGYQWRYIQSLDEVKAFLASGSIGMALGYWLGGMPKVPWWRVQHLSGGQFVEQTTHITDMLRYLCGEVVEVYAAYGHRILHELEEGANVADVGTVTMKLANGAVATISNSCMLPAGHKTGINVYTEQGVAEVQSNGTRIVRTKEEASAPFSNTPNPRVFEDQAFLDAVRTGDQSLIKSSYADSLKTHEITIAANLSAATGKPVKLS
ncbi:Gfo/Idh/MocA family protein [Paenibacillus ginsengarvi]|uniref:Gfo/Idh/MocA family oxidoreductase n=1 Tax=Paenibacillus ginsengarvi TaxID=400777 RepID=A0A3B0CGB9_9BACL|nr:Gfo/Idh/MocA family oxidoreductase [Paenibacillus ginsengarvi]RKN84402.1 gfo/Idh/MocA family oxidoreductase [Paenibacillus ginsengarvi]